MFKKLISISILAFVVIGGEAFRDKRQTAAGCPPGTGGCNCVCNCGGGGGNGGTTCPPCPPTMMPPTGGPPTGSTGGMGNMTTTTTMGTIGADTCFPMIRAAANLSTGQLLGLLLTTLLSNLVVPILQTVLAGNNTLEGAVIPLANILCYVVGLLLLTLRSLGLLGLLGLNGLLQNILGGGIG